MAKAVVRADNLAGIVDGSKLVSIRYYNNNTEAAIENGSVVKIDSLIANTRGANGHVWKAVNPTAADTAPTTDFKLAVVASPEYLYDKTYAGLDEYENAAGKDCLAYLLQPSDVFAVTKEAFVNSTAPTSTNKYVKMAGSTPKLTAVSSDTGCFADVIATETEGGYTYYVLRVRMV